MFSWGKVSFSSIIRLNFDVTTKRVEGVKNSVDSAMIIGRVILELLINGFESLTNLLERVNILIY